MADLKISQLSEVTQLSGSDTLPVVHSGITQKVQRDNLIIRATTLVVAASNSLHQNSADYICDGVADDVQINAAIAALTGAGGRVILLDGIFNLAAAIVINSSNICLEGQGNTTQLFVTNNANLLAAISITGTGTVQYKVKNLRIEGNSANQANGNGINVNTPWQNAANKFDPNGVFDDIFINDVKNNGFAVTASSDTRVMHLKRVRVRGALGNGFYMPQPSCTDSIFDDCIAETAALNGFYMGGLNSHFINCKTFYCGSAGGNNHGFYIAGYNNYFENCEAQDNYQSGFYSQNDGDATYGAQYCTFLNCIADSNGQNGGTTYAVGLQAKNVTGWQIIGGIFMTRPYPSFTQRIGISLEGTTTGVRVVGVQGVGNSSALYSDSSSGTNYPLHIQGITTVLSNNINVGTNEILLGDGTPFISGSGKVILIDGATNSIHLQNYTELFMNMTNPVIQTYNASDQTVQIINNGGGKASLSVNDDFSNGGNAGVSGLGKTLGFYGHTQTTQQILATGASKTVDNVITALQTLGLVKQS